MARAKTDDVAVNETELTAETFLENEDFLSPPTTSLPIS